MRRTVFSEFEEIEIAARLQAVRERLQERVEEAAAASRKSLEDQAEAAQVQRQRQAQAASMVQVGWSGEKLGQSESPESHLLLVKNTIEIDPSDRFKIPVGQPREGQVDWGPGSNAVKFLMTSLERDFAADLQEKNGTVDNDDEQLQVQAFAYPDVGLPSRKPFARASYAELEDVVRRNAVASCTVDTLSTRLEGRVYDPEDDDLLGWFKDRRRDYKPLKGSVVVNAGVLQDPRSSPARPHLAPCENSQEAQVCGLTAGRTQGQQGWQPRGHGEGADCSTGGARGSSKGGRDSRAGVVGY